MGRAPWKRVVQESLLTQACSLQFRDRVEAKKSEITMVLESGEMGHSKPGEKGQRMAG